MQDRTGEGTVVTGGASGPGAAIGGVFARADVSDPASVASAVTRVLANCAGIGGAARPVSRGAAHDPSLFERVPRVNPTGAFDMASQVAARMVTADPVDEDGARGVIVNTASVAACDGQVGQVAYAASRGGTVAMTLPMARDLAEKGIRLDGAIRMASR